ncbi:MAG: 4-hydroxybenzoate polyprenyltransferase, partial [Candidatus Lokiarchaeia archaeon]|nr:4-hydroxybenzoate polyprenyltransferase [Candidatus Lokiarchaeia archaeon]
SLPFMLLPFAFVPLLIFFGFLKYYFLPLTIFSILSLIVFILLIKESESKTLENVYAWSFMYLEYLFFELGFTILIIFGEMGTLTFLT